MLPSHTLVHLGWVVRHLAHADGYLNAAGQEACHTVQALATGLDRFSDALRQAVALLASGSTRSPAHRALPHGNIWGTVGSRGARTCSELRAPGQQDKGSAGPRSANGDEPRIAEDSEFEPLDAGAWDEAPTIDSSSSDGRDLHWPG